MKSTITAFNSPNTHINFDIMIITRTLIIIALVAFSLNVSSQEKSNRIEVGYSINQYQSDFGVGIHFISPYFLKSKVAVRLGLNQQWFQSLNGTETIWSPYQNVQLGVKARNTVIENKIYIYGEGGFLTMIPNSDFSSNSTEFGGYGVFGFEFKSSPRFGYFIELGGVGTGAIADREINNPIYSNGFLTNVGFRVGL